MSRVCITTKTQIKLQENTLAILERNCNEMLPETEMENEYIFQLGSEYFSSKGPAMLAVSKFNNGYALYAPEYLSEEQMIVFKIFFEKVKENETVFVFSQRDYAAVKKFRGDKKIDVKIML